jgi:hypothetical protein
MTDGDLSLFTKLITMPINWPGTLVTMRPSGGRRLAGAHVALQVLTGRIPRLSRRLTARTARQGLSRFSARPRIPTGDIGPSRSGADGIGFMHGRQRIAEL